jgi:hypothetical protein
MLKHWPQGLQIGLPNSMVSFFHPLGPIQGHHKVQHLLLTWGRLKRFFLSSALTPNVKALGTNFNFGTNRNVLDLGWTSAMTHHSVKRALLVVIVIAIDLLRRLVRMTTSWGKEFLLGWNFKKVHDKLRLTQKKCVCVWETTNSRKTILDNVVQVCLCYGRRTQRIGKGGGRV